MIVINTFKRVAACTEAYAERDRAALHTLNVCNVPYWSLSTLTFLALQGFSGGGTGDAATLGGKRWTNSAVGLAAGAAERRRREVLRRRRLRRRRLGGFRTAACSSGASPKD